MMLVQNEDAGWTDKIRATQHVYSKLKVLG